MFGLIFSLLVGALAGYIAGRIMGSETSAVRNIVLGILGGFVGNILFSLIGLSARALWARFSSLWSVPVSVSGSAANCSSKRLNTTIKNTSAFV
ncbi:GlsB/YeaQ/YmgE family stress response membrane protein [Faecalibacterium sp. OF04-11AC]|uniref:GlsB/YeaQ/YmgE family stress response membrane protein n=1 Tax=Faecalibacterium sp. OF04-11AC TaxID=2293109 RepID=UPI001FA8EC15|nr:GlsB/YeaQ/YmgE family stress response membrane protein [Faecalibacterium sp. OF04-11AC]